MEKLTKDEFDCPCCGENRIAPAFFNLLLRARQLVDPHDVVFIINSGYRCWKHNLKVGGSHTSSHLVGLAADIRCTNSSDRSLMLTAFMDVGLNRFVLYPTWIHTDFDLYKPQNVIDLKL